MKTIFVTLNVTVKAITLIILTLLINVNFIQAESTKIIAESNSNYQINIPKFNREIVNSENISIGNYALNFAINAQENLTSYSDLGFNKSEVRNKINPINLPDMQITHSDESASKKFIAPLIENSLFNLNQDIESFTAKMSKSLAAGKTAESIAQENIEMMVTNAEAAFNNETNRQINTRAQSILGQFGKSQTNITIDSKGNITNYDLSVFSPLYDRDQHVFFSQNAIREQGDSGEKRIVGNFGLGYRYFQTDGDFAVGLNSFIDHDFTGSNTRMSLGAEYWKNYFKLAANYYLPISEWKDSSVLQGYDERPAKGYDIRMQGYLPSNPHIGGSLVFEQYLGDEVALFSKEELQHNPLALSAGIDYTPFPLLTVGATHKIGESGHSDTQINMQMNLQMGIPLEEQLKAENVELTRNLMGSRYDLVDRNNEIVFEYRKQSFEVTITPLNYINSSANNSYEYYLSDLINISASNNSKTPIKNFRWVITPEFNQNTVFTNENKLQFNALSTGTFYVTLYLTNEEGITAKSNTLLLKVIDGNSNYVATLSFIQRTDINEGLFDFNRNGQIDENGSDIDDRPNLLYIFNDTSFIPSQVPNKLTNQFVHLTVDLETVDGREVDLSDADTDININYIYEEVKTQISLDINEVDSKLVVLKKYRDATKINRWHFIVVTSSFDVYLESTEVSGIPLQAEIIYADETIKTNNEKLFVNYLQTDAVATDPLLQIQLIERGQDGSENGIVILDTGGMQRRTVKKNIKLDTYYEVKVFETVLTEIDGKPTWFTAEITPEIQDTLVWHYYNPIQEKAIGTVNRDNQYYGLEACQGFTMFSTQVNNFQNNELAWGEIGDNFIKIASEELNNNQAMNLNSKKLTEQYLQLEVQFDISRRVRTKSELNKEKILCSDKIPASEKYYDLMLKIADIDPKVNENRSTIVKTGAK
ncbi:inverse autotransporter beta domain-containing protein [Thorsellia kenyensis]|uniref:Inverse autotransporter beta domain-containing protein n=1 Tax=Thorsellia kenyensis TaxID=1549888 RepID=A0ABV6C917_9GAMM